MSDQRYAVRTLNNAVYTSCRPQQLRAGDKFQRFHCIPSPEVGGDIGIASDSKAPLKHLNHPGSAEHEHKHKHKHHHKLTDSSAAITAAAAASVGPVDVVSVVDSNSSSNVTGVVERGYYPVVYHAGQLVEVRYYGDSSWLPARIVKADTQVPTAHVTV